MRSRCLGLHETILETPCRKAIIAHRHAPGYNVVFVNLDLLYQDDSGSDLIGLTGLTLRTASATRLTPRTSVQRHGKVLFARECRFSSNSAPILSAYRLYYLRRPNLPFAPPLAPFAVRIFSLLKFAWADALIFRPAVLTTPSFA
jgi:hypothetical protein